MKKVIGIDLGGTSVRVAKITEEGQVLQELKRPSYAQEGPEKVLSNIIEMVEEIENWNECVGIGMGVPGPVDTVNNVMTMASNLPGAERFPFAQRLEEKFGIPAFLDNDANVAGLAEALVGAGKGKPIVYYVTISTGIGGALIINGKVHAGKQGYAGEIGNIIVNGNEKKSKNLNAGAVEAEASGTAIGREGNLRLGDKVTSAKDVFDLARAKDPVALEICDKMAQDLATMFSVIAHVTDPHCFVIGGGCMNAKDCFFDNMVECFKKKVHTPMRTVEFLEAQLSEPGIVGAAMLPISHGL